MSVCYCCCSWHSGWHRRDGVDACTFSLISRDDDQVDFGGGPWPQRAIKPNHANAACFIIITGGGGSLGEEREKTTAGVVPVVRCNKLAEKLHLLKLSQPNERTTDRTNDRCPTSVYAIISSGNDAILSPPQQPSRWKITSFAVLIYSFFFLLGSIFFRFFSWTLLRIRFIYYWKWLKRLEKKLLEKENGVGGSGWSTSI